jgi:hypothetical protein
MFNLTSTTDLLQITGAIATGGANLQVLVDYVDASSSGTVFTPGNQPTLITGNTATTICASPAASVQRGISHISIANAAANACTFTFNRIAGTTTVQVFPGISAGTTTIPAGYSLEYNEQNGWVLIDKSLGRVETPLSGRLIARTVLSSGTSFTTSASTNTVIAKLQGGGGGSGGITGAATSSWASGGGGGGSYLEKTVAVSPNTAYTIAIGAAGTAGATAGGTGGNGGSTTLAVGGTTYTAPGGTGSVGGTATAALLVGPGGAGGAVPTNGDLNVGGEPGNPGITLIPATGIMASGSGGHAPGFGASGAPLTSTGGVGNAGIGFGAGGSGSSTNGATNRVGIAGLVGAMIIEEYS